MEKKSSLIILVIAVAIACFLIFRPFLIDIFIAVMLVSVLYKPYQKLAGFLRHKYLASFVMCLLAVVLIIFPLTELAIYAARSAPEAYHNSLVFLQEHRSKLLNGAGFFGLENQNIKAFTTDFLQKYQANIIDVAASVIKGTTDFFVSLLIIVFSMFFFFVDGRKLLAQALRLSPLPEEYNLRILKKFRVVSKSVLISTFIVAGIQGLIGAIGFLIVGTPALFPGILIGITSLIPYIGSAIIYLPLIVYLLFTGSIWQAFFLLVWGAIAVGSVDNILRAYMMKDKVQVHPLFVIFSIVGGASLLGFWGIVIGPLIVALAVTVFHIYELEFNSEIKEEDLEN